ncbi:Putative bifunctional phosphatase/peptidyl-prolyl cis-trans isomerase [Kingella potus]|uniref:Bifunctional phosphatase/peptidyl-prolyl cis-trans isomerase n=1 Tax=Kingella potus TaxID=265175 RepID=A0A377R383_9NEIS|nr:Cof-type HAD-IIB family hydrolase [Kingella potus]STR03388.1 Putative bifunctional phosphatase/peptidyl-prolyl cis-trans isomerase [Kingella potus]
MNRKPKIIFFDIDDTLLPKRSGRIPDSTRAALGRLKGQGIAAAIATGRPPCLIPDSVRTLMADSGIDILISINGQHIERGGEVLAQYPLRPVDTAAAVAHLHSLGIAYALEHPHRVAVPQDHPHIRTALGSLAIPYQTGAPDPAQPVCQMLAFYGEEQAAAVEAGLPAGLRTTRWHAYGVDILPADSSKARGIRAVLDTLGLAAADAMAFGDGLNDMEMLQSVGCGVAVGNAHPALKAVARHICPPADQDGILRGLTALGVLD